MSAPPPGYWTPTTTPRLATAPGRPPVNSWAWTSLIVSVSGFLVPLGVNGLVGAIFAFFGFREARKIAAAGFTDTGRSLALAGLIIGIVHIVLTIAVIVLIVLGVGWFQTVLQELQATNGQA